jgi:agmatinase
VKDMVVAFDPNAPALQGRLFGLPFSIEESELVIVPVPVDMTTSSGKGTAYGPQAVLDASAQVDLYDLTYKNFREKGISMLPIQQDIVDPTAAAIAQAIVDNLAQWKDPSTEDLAIVNQASLKINDYVYTQTKALLDQWKKVALLGGDHSTPYGFMKALGEVHGDFAVLQMDAHCDLRQAYEWFTYSHASIFYNVMETIPQVSKLVQVGIRDFCEEESDYVSAHADKITIHFDRHIQQALYSGKTRADYMRTIIDQLPEKVYISFDIDALDPKLCGHTGTPVPGGLEFEQAAMLLDMVAAKKTIIGFDLNEVGNDPRDANVGARMLFRLCAQFLSSASQ